MLTHGFFVSTTDLAPQTLTCDSPTLLPSFAQFQTCMNSSNMKTESQPLVNAYTHSAGIRWHCHSQRWPLPPQSGGSCGQAEPLTSAHHQHLPEQRDRRVRTGAYSNAAWQPECELSVSRLACAFICPSTSLPYSFIHGTYLRNDWVKPHCV